MPYTPLEWKDGPQGGTPITAAALNRMEQGIVDAHAVIDAATSGAQANTLVRRDSNGRASVADPTSSSHIATKGYVDSHANATSVHGATSSATANRLIIRDSNGRASVVDPTSASHIATKGYVDGNFARIYPTIYEVDFDGTIEIEAGGFIEREVVIPSTLAIERFGVIHTFPPFGLGYIQFNNTDITVGRRQIVGTGGSTQPALVVRLWNRGSNSVSFTGSFKIYLMIILFP